MICSLSVIWTGKWHGAGRNFTLPATIWKTKMTVKHFVTRSRRYSSRSLSKWTTIPWIQRWWYFFEGSIGCIGILKQWLVRSLYRALREESPELTRAHLEHQIEHKGGKWVFSELKNEPVLSYFYCITSCLLAHCPFGRFFLASFPLYSGGSDATLAHPR